MYDRGGVLIPQALKGNLLIVLLIFQRLLLLYDTRLLDLNLLVLK